MSVIDTAPGGMPRLPRLLYEPADVEELLTVSHATLYRLIRAGRLDAKKIGSKTVITAASIERFIAELPAAGARGRSARP
jgi:excisionase family DNA binding protein